MSLNQEKFASGDTIFYNARVVHTDTHTPVPGNSLLNVFLADSSGACVLKQKVRVVNGEAANQLVIPATFTSGIYRLVAFDERQRDVIRASWFQQFIAVAGEKEFQLKTSAPVQQPGMLSQTASIVLDKKKFQPREKIEARLQQQPGTVLPEKVAVTVFSKTLCSVENANTLTDTLKYNASRKREASDSLAHYVDQHFRGTVLSATDGTLLRDTMVITFLLPQNVMTLQVYAIDGRFDLPIFPDFYGDEDVIYRIEKRGQEVPEAKVAIEENTIARQDRFRFGASVKPDALFALSEQRNAIDRSYRFYSHNAGDKAISKLQAVVEEEVFGADIETDLSDYLLFPTMEETIREIIPLVQHRKVKEQHVVRIFWSDRNKLATQSPMYVIDGVMTDDTNYFLSLNPADVSKVKVIYSRDKLKNFGSMARGGIIIVETKIPGNAKNVPRSSNSFYAHGLTEPMETGKLITPPDARTPDLRTTLYWNPALKKNADGSVTFSFFASDLTGDFEIRVQGSAADGREVFLKETFQVEFRPSWR